MSSSSTPSGVSEFVQTNKNKGHEELVTITEKISLTKNQHEILNIICNTYEESISKYLQEALVEAMRFDIEEGNFSDVLLEKITDKKEENIDKENKGSSFFTGSSVKNDLDADLQF